MRRSTKPSSKNTRVSFLASSSRTTASDRVWCCGSFHSRQTSRLTSSFFSKSSDEWNAVFIELEKPASKFFRGNTNTFHRDFVDAKYQMTRWRAWLSSDQNKQAFLSSVKAIQVPSNMA